MVTRFILAASLFVAAAAQAAPGLDLALIVDRSGSMSRELRSGMQLIELTAELMERNARLQRVDHRLAVITFGSAARVSLPFTFLDSTVALQQTLAGIPPGTAGNTDMRAALVTAEQMFRSLPADPSRRRAVVVFTDGVLYVRGAETSLYRDELRHFVLTSLARAGVTVDVLLVARGGRNVPFWRTVSRNTAIISGGPDDLLAHAYGIVTSLVGTITAKSVPVGNGGSVEVLVVPPYLEVVAFDVFRAEREAAVDVFPPESTTPLRAGADGVELVRVGDVLETLVVPRPRPGAWVIRKSRANATVRILSQQFFPRGVLIQPAGTIRRSQRATMIYRLLDSNGRPLAELPGYALSLRLSVTGPDSSVAIVAMERARRAEFRSSREMEWSSPGHYWSDVRVMTVDVQARSLEVFRDRWSGFTVLPASNGDRTMKQAIGVVPAAKAEQSRWISAALLGTAAVAAIVFLRWRRRA